MVDVQLKGIILLLFKDWLNHWGVTELLPNEKKATCGDCLMARQGRFRKDLKCCTFQPFLPCFSVGGLFANGIFTQERLKHEARVLPIGLLPGVTYQKNFAQSAFGQKEETLCSYFTRGSCGVWDYRSSVCATYFCESSFNENGLAFWQSYEKFLNLLETTLVYEALFALGFTLPEVRRCYAAFSSEAEDQVLWQEFSENHAQFYLQTYEWARGLSAADVWALLGQEAQAAKTELELIASRF